MVATAPAWRQRGGVDRGGADFEEGNSGGGDVDNDNSVEDEDDSTKFFRPKR